MSAAQISQIVTWCIIGAIAGFLAGRLVWGKRFRLLTAVIIGLIGALIGGLLFNFLKVPVPFNDVQLTIKLSDIIVSLVGAIVVLFIVALIERNRG